MIRFICHNKTNYRNGQIFPFMLAILAVMMIMLMMTANLGQLSIYKTDTSNAADAGALAGASMLSNALLSLGLSNDALAGRAFVTLAAALVCIITVVAVAAGVGMLIAHVLKANGEYMQSITGSIMAWSQAKKTAMQYALQNVGVDEPRISLERFVRRVYDGEDVTMATPERRAFLQEVYEYGYDRTQPLNTQRDVYNAGRAGFGLYSSDDREGWWKYGEIKPNNHKTMGPVSTAYGWNNKPKFPDEDVAGYNSYDDGNRGTGNPGGYSLIDYNNFCQLYDNAIFIKVDGPSGYTLEPVSAIQNISGTLDCLEALINDHIPDFLTGVVSFLFDILDFILNFVTELIDGIVGGFPTSFALKDELSQIQKSVVTVTVHRYRKPSNRSGMWNFVYGGQAFADVRSVSRAGLVDDRAERNPDLETMEGCATTMASCCFTCIHGKAVPADPLFAIICPLINGDEWPNGLWSSNVHLYESRILATG